MKVLLDTNVIVSAFATRGMCHDIFLLCVQKHTVYASPFILAEVETVLREKFNIPPAKVSKMTAYLHDVMVFVTPTVLPASVTCRDSNDLEILAAALTGGVDVLVTGDEDLLILEKEGEVQILSPRGFWQFEQGN